MSDIPPEIQNVLTDCAKTILPQVYTDLAQPGVKAVGQALGTVLELSSTILLPLKLFNEKAKLLFAKRMNEYKEKLEKIPEDKRASVPPEIGVPILEKLTHTTNDDIAQMFTTLLASASNTETENAAHPSFVSMVERLSPDEAKILKYFRNEIEIPYCKVNANLENGYYTLLPRGTKIKTAVQLTFPENEQAYLANFESMGILKDHENEHKTDDQLYEEIKKVHQVDMFEQFASQPPYHGITVEKGFYEITKFGRMFIYACIGKV